MAKHLFMTDDNGQNKLSKLKIKKKKRQRNSNTASLPKNIALLHCCQELFQKQSYTGLINPNNTTSEIFSTFALSENH